MEKLTASIQKTISAHLEKLENDNTLNHRERIELIHKLLPYILPKCPLVPNGKTENDNSENDPIAKYLSKN